jgi:methionine synthase II (cobalamin-independent)
MQVKNWESVGEHLDAEVFEAAKNEEEAVVFFNEVQTGEIGEPVMSQKTKRVEKAENVSLIIREIRESYDVNDVYTVWIPHFMVEIADYCSNLSEFQKEVRKVKRSD